MSSAIRKLMEAAWMRLYAPYLWSTVMECQIGFRPGEMMGKNTMELIQDLTSRQYDSIWFIDLAQAFPSPTLTLIIEELDRRREVLNLAYPELGFGGKQ